MKIISNQHIGKFLGASIIFLASCGSVRAATLIDTTPPPFNDPPSPWVSLADQSVITYAFKTSWDGIVWSQEQKSFIYDAINQIDDVLTNQVFVESGDFTLRWAGSDFFRDWRDATHPQDGWNLTGTLAVAYKHNNGPWDPIKYPNNEIYFNTFDQPCNNPSDPNYKGVHPT